jgi:hypothetical protein
MRGLLDPVTQAKIDAFASRRRQLILIRGTCAVLSILLGTMTLLAVADYFILMPDGIRYVLSGLAYASAIAGAWYTCARLVWRSLDPRELARLIEQVRPDLREDLLSAVELGDESSAQKWESVEFRELLQESVARRVRTVDVREVLSFRRISRWVGAAAGISVLVLGLTLIPGFRYDHLLMRSLLPMANFERVSRVKIRVVEPNPAERVVPQGDVVAVKVRLEGPEVKHVYLETFPKGKRSERVEMVLAGSREFESAVAVGREGVEYRIRAGDALTRKYLLSSVARPEAISFRKSYEYPAYAKRTARVVDEDNGDLAELEGSVCDLEITVNQEVREARLAIERAGKSFELALEPSGEPRKLRTRIPINASGTYRVHLVSASSGFENKFSPQYEIRSMPDLVPRVVLEEPAEDLIVPPDDVIAIKGVARDDLGIRRVVQAVRINQNEWMETPLAEESGAEVQVSRMWDLYDLKVQPGDRVVTKLVAVDLKGNRAESSPVHFTITARGFDPNRLVPLVAKQALYAELVQLREAVQAYRSRLDEVRKAGAEELGLQQALASAAGDAEKVLQECDQAEARAKAAARLARPGREGSDLIQVARLLRRVKDEALPASKAALDRQAPDEAQRAADRAVAAAAAAQDAYRELLASEESIAALNDGIDLLRDQLALHRQFEGARRINDPKAFERLARRQGVAAAQIEILEGLLGTLSKRAEDSQAKRAARLKEQLAKSRTTLSAALQKAADASIEGPSRAMHGTVDQVLRAIHEMEHALDRRGLQARERLVKEAGPSWNDVRETAELMRLLAELQAKPERGEEIRRREKDLSDRSLLRWKAARAQLEARAGMEESRRDADPFWVADVSLAGRAAQAVLDLHRAQPEGAKSRETLLVIEKAVRTLEAGHLLWELAQNLRTQAESDRWHGSAVDASTRSPKEWDWMDARMKDLSAEFRGAELSTETLKDLERSWQGLPGDQVRREMRERHRYGRPVQPVARVLERLSVDVARLTAQIQPAMEEARKALRALVPSLPQRLAQLSEAARTLRKKTDQLADQAPQSEASQTKPEAGKLLDNQQGLDAQIDDVMAELRRDANVQDLFTEQGRERARDADDAVAMLRQAPPKAEDMLRQAAASQQAQAQEHALNQAAEQQGKLADALKTLADHYDNLAKNKPEETRSELRKAEEQLGIKEQLDQQYAQMERLAELAQQPQQDALKDALKEALKSNEAMQRELERLTQNALDRAEAALQQAAQMEQQAAQNQTAKAEQQKGLPESAKKLAEEARRMAAQDVPKVAQEAQKAQANAAQQPLEDAKRDLNEGAQAVPQNFDNLNEAAKGLDKAAQEFNEAAADLRRAQQAAQAQANQAQQQAQKEMQQAQQAQQKAAAENQQAQQAQQAAQQAQQAARNAQQAAQQQPQNPAAQQAAQRAEEASAKAQQNAQKKAQQAQAAQQAVQKENAEAQAAQQMVQAAQQAAQSAGQEAQDAAELARQAQGLAQQARQAAQADMAQATQQQAEVAKALEGAQRDLQQAAQNEAAQSDAQSAQALEQVAQGVQAANQNQVQAAQQAAQEGSAQKAAQTAQAAQQAIEAQAQALAQARGRDVQTPPASASGMPDGALADAAAEFLAQALNALNAEGQTPSGQQPGQPQPGQAPQGQPGQQGEQGQGQGEAAQQALASAAQAQAQAMRQGRTPGQAQQGQGQQPGQNPLSQSQTPGKGASVDAGQLPEGAVPNALLKAGEWGKLPPRLARDLMESQREGVSGEYRHMVETYFRVIAERARDKR